MYNANYSYLGARSLMRLSDLPKGTAAMVDRVDDAHAADAIAQRLRDLGFVQGERVRVVATGPLGADPLLIQIGYTRFALRRAEAARVNVLAEQPA
jgi:ferrous iron transport protein A